MDDNTLKAILRLCDLAEQYAQWDQDGLAQDTIEIIAELMKRVQPKAQEAK